MKAGELRGLLRVYRLRVYLVRNHYAMCFCEQTKILSHGGCNKGYNNRGKIFAKHFYSFLIDFLKNMYTYKIVVF